MSPSFALIYNVNRISTKTVISLLSDLNPYLSKKKKKKDFNSYMNKHDVKTCEWMCLWT